MSRHVSSKRRSRSEKHRAASPVSVSSVDPFDFERGVRKERGRDRDRHTYHHNSSGYLTGDSGHHRGHKYRTLYRPVGYNGYDYYPVMDHRRLHYDQMPPPYFYDPWYNLPPHGRACNHHGNNYCHNSCSCHYNNHSHHAHQLNDCCHHNQNNCCDHTSGCDYHNIRSCFDNQNTSTCCDNHQRSDCCNQFNDWCTNQCQECNHMTGCKFCFPHIETKTTGIQTDPYQHHHMGVQTDHKHHTHHHHHQPVHCETCLNYSKVLEKILPAPEKAYRLIAPPRPPSDMHAKLRIAKGKDNVKVYTIEKQRGPFKSYEKIHSTLNDEI